MERVYLGSKKSKYVIILLTFLIISLVLLLIFSLFFIFKISRTESQVNGSDSTFQYQTIHYHRNITTFGLTTTRIPISSPFMSYHTPSSTSFVSEPSPNHSKYTCSGSCVCKDDSKRKSATVLNRSLVILLSALSTSLASKMAEEVFRNQCMAQYSEICDEEDIDPELEGCLEHEMKWKTKSGVVLTRYYCSGKCQDKEFIQETELTKKSLREFGCPDLHTSGEVWIKRVRGKVKYFDYDEEKKKMVRQKFSLMGIHARERFAEKWLTPFCQYSSKVGRNHELSQELGYDELSLCSGKNEKDPAYQHIECYTVTHRHAEGDIFF